jgi:DNA-binding GntR family transcriptional regulator
MAVAVRGAHLAEQVYDEIRGRLLTRRYPAGAKLSLYGLAAELGVSEPDTPSHDAPRLRSLLTVRARRGYFVTPVTADALAEGYDVRLALKLHAAERAIDSVATPELLVFRSLLDSTAATISHEEWDAANAAFHEYQIDLAGNTLLSRFYRELSVNLLMQVIRGGHVEGHANLVTEHARIIEAFEARDLERARSAIREHIETERRIALEAIERAGGVL